MAKKNIINQRFIDFKKEFDILYIHTVGVNYGRRQIKAT